MSATKICLRMNAPLQGHVSSKERAKLHNLLQGSKAGLVTLQQVYQCGMIFKLMQTQTRDYKAEGKIAAYISIIRANTKEDCESRNGEIPLTQPHAYLPSCLVSFVTLRICKSSCFIISCITFSVSWKDCIKVFFNKDFEGKESCVLISWWGLFLTCRKSFPSINCQVVRYINGPNQIHLSRFAK